MKLSLLCILCCGVLSTTAQAAFTVGGARAGVVIPFVAGDESNQLLSAYLEEGREVHTSDAAWSSSVTPTAELYLYPSLRKNDFLATRFGVLYTHRRFSYNENTFRSNGSGTWLQREMSLSVEASSVEFPVLITVFPSTRSIVRPYLGVGASLGFFIDNSYSSYDRQTSWSDDTTSTVIGTRENPLEVELVDVLFNFHFMLGAKVKFSGTYVGLEARYVNPVFFSMISSIRSSDHANTKKFPEVSSQVLSITGFVEIPL